LVHNYLGDIDAQTVKTVIDRYIPELAQCIKAMLALHDNSLS